MHAPRALLRWFGRFGRSFEGGPSSDNLALGRRSLARGRRRLLWLRFCLAGVSLYPQLPELFFRRLLIQVAATTLGSRLVTRALRGRASLPNDASILAAASVRTECGPL